MDNKIHNNLSFQAKFISKATVKGVSSKKMGEIGDYFKHLTKKYQNDSLTLSRDASSEKSLVVSLNNPSGESLFGTFALYITEFEEKMSKLTPKEIATKFAKLFRCMKAEEKYLDIIEPINNNIRHTSIAYANNINHAKNTANKRISNCYMSICKENQARLAVLDKLKEKELFKLSKQTDRIIGSDSDFSYIQDFYSHYMG